MTKVKIPFMEKFREPMLNGTKTVTSRTRKMGNVGDTFETFGAEFQIDKIMNAGLRWSADHWREEGCSSKQDFLDVWGQIHKRRGFRPEDWVVVHVFHRVKTAEEVKP